MCVTANITKHIFRHSSRAKLAFLSTLIYYFPVIATASLTNLTLGWIQCQSDPPQGPLGIPPLEGWKAKLGVSYILFYCIFNNPNGLQTDCRGCSTTGTGDVAHPTQPYNLLSVAIMSTLRNLLKYLWPDPLCRSGCRISSTTLTRRPSTSSTCAMSISHSKREQEAREKER